MKDPSGYTIDFPIEIPKIPGGWFVFFFEQIPNEPTPQVVSSEAMDQKIKILIAITFCMIFSKPKTVLPNNYQGDCIAIIFSFLQSYTPIRALRLSQHYIELQELLPSSLATARLANGKAWRYEFSEH